MRFLPLIVLPALISLSGAPVARAVDETEKLTACQRYGELAYRMFDDRDKGVAAATQLKPWQEMSDRIPDRKQAIQRAGTVVDYAYSEEGKNLTPDEARTAFFRGCRSSNSANISPAPKVVPPIEIPIQ